MTLTTAYKNFSNVSETKRFKKTLQQFNALKEKIGGSISMYKAIKILKEFLQKIID